MTGELCILDRTGDTRHTWDSTKPEEVKAAREVFDRLRKTHLAYRVNRDGDKGEVIDRFDPTAERMILAPQMVGG